MRDYKKEFEKRVAFIKKILFEAKSDGIIFGNSGGKDSALVGILCKAACDNTVGVIMPCASKRNFEEDKTDGIEVANSFGIETKLIDLTTVRNNMIDLVAQETHLTNMAKLNVAPRLRMITLYMIAASENRLVAGTGNKSEVYMGYFTKWGDGGYDFNPIADLTATEIFEFLKYLNCPENIIKKSPSAGLFEGQTDEQEMGISYKELDDYILYGIGTKDNITLIEKFHKSSEHKRQMPTVYYE